MSEAGAPRDFELIQDANEGLRMVREGAKGFASTMIWTRNQEHVINTHISIYSDSGLCFYCAAPKGFEPKRFAEDLARMGEKDCYFSVSLIRANIFFKTRYLGYDPAGLQFKLPVQVYKVQRRKDLRFPIPDGLALRVEFTDPLAPSTLLTKKVIDISASGMAFLIDKDDAPVFPVGLTLNDFTFTVKSRKIRVSAEIRNTRPMRPGARMKGIAVGVVFKDIRPGDSQHIAGYVFEESRKYFTRFI